MDAGTGSGILAMVALRLGAASALGIDNDAVALQCAREYAAANAFGPEIDLRVASLQDLGSEKFDVIAANLDGETLLRLSAALRDRMRTEGIGCLSGVQKEDYEEIAGALANEGWNIRAQVERNGWLALEVKSA